MAEGESDRVEETDLVERLEQRVAASFKAEDGLMGIPVSATDRAVQTLLTARRTLSAGRPPGSVLDRVSDLALRRVNWRHPED